MRGVLVIGAALLLSGCEGTLHSVADHMPVIGERCESWQCFTSSGQAQSDVIKAEKLRLQQGGKPAAPAPNTKPLPAEDPNDPYDSYHP